MPFVAGFLLGLAGSGHCVAMCGPLVLAFGRRGDVSARRSLQHTLTYHGGRLTTYVLVGLVAGLAGQAVATLGFERLLAVSLGSALIVSAAMGAGHTALGQTVWSAVGVRWSVRAGAWSRRHTVAGPALMGAANGLLPCGLLYAAFVAAAALGHVRDALLFIGGFGLGTMPALAALTSLATRLPPRLRPRIARAAPLILASIGALLIARGLIERHGRHDPHGAAPPSTIAAAPAHAHRR